MHHQPGICYLGFLNAASLAQNSITLSSDCINGCWRRVISFAGQMRNDSPTTQPMTATESIILNFEEIRRRSILIWKAIPQHLYTWRPDAHAMTCLEMVRHVLEAEHLFHQIVQNRGDLGNYPSPWQHQPYSNVEDELLFAKSYRASFLTMLQHLPAEELHTVEIIRKEKGQRRFLGDYLNRIAYHESVHAGQLLGYLRQLQVERPQIWD